MFSRLFAILLLAGGVTASFVAYAVDMPSQYNEDFASNFNERFVPAVNPFPLPSLLMEDDKQKQVMLKDFQGRYVVLNLWATWCGPCVKEMPALDKLSSTLDPKKIVIIALNQNSNGHDITERFYNEHALTHLAIYVDSAGRVPSLVKAKGLPTTLLIDPTGVEIGRLEGAADWASPNAMSFINDKMNALKTK